MRREGGALATNKKMALKGRKNYLVGMVASGTVAGVTVLEVHPNKEEETAFALQGAKIPVHSSTRVDVPSVHTALGGQFSWYSR